MYNAPRERQFLVLAPAERADRQASHQRRWRQGPVELAAHAAGRERHLAQPLIACGHDEARASPPRALSHAPGG